MYLERDEELFLVVAFHSESLGEGYSGASLSIYFTYELCIVLSSSEETQDFRLSHYERSW